MARSKKTTTQQPSEPKGPPPKLTDDQQRALFFFHRARWLGLQKEFKAAQKALMDAGKAAKADGVPVQQIKDSIKLEEKHGAEEIKQKLIDTIRVAEWMGADVGKQADLFAEAIPSDPAYEHGKTAGMRGDPRATPSHYTSKENSWLDGWKEGDRLRAEVIARVMEKEKPADNPKPKDDEKQKDAFDDALSDQQPANGSGAANGNGAAAASTPTAGVAGSTPPPQGKPALAVVN